MNYGQKLGNFFSTKFNLNYTNKQRAYNIKIKNILEKDYYTFTEPCELFQSHNKVVEITANTK